MGSRLGTWDRLARRFFPGPVLAGVATGTAFPDALAGGARVGRDGGPVLLSDPASLPDAVAAYLGEVSGSVERGVLFGGSSALSDAVEAEVAQLVQQG